MFYVYIVECSDGAYYVGFTSDISQRLREHNDGFYKTAYTFSRRPVKLLYYVQFADAAEAKKFERQLKGWRREKKEALIRGDYNSLIDLSKPRLFKPK